MKMDLLDLKTLDEIHQSAERGKIDEGIDPKIRMACLDMSIAALRLKLLILESEINKESAK